MYYICKPPNLSELTPVISKYGVNPLRLEDLHISSTQGVKEAQGFPFRNRKSWASFTALHQNCHVLNMQTISGEIN